MNCVASVTSAERQRRTAPASGTRWPGQLTAHAFLATAVVVPLVLTKRGLVAADSKQLLFVDASRYLSRVPWMWDPTVGLGTVTHQNIGYLFPMGPFFWLGSQLGIPVWVTQRLWLALVLFTAGAGVLFLARTLCWNGPGPLIAAFAYALTPYTLQYATHLSVLLLPYAALGWLLAFTIRSLEAGGWRWPAWFAMAVAASGSGNATALACVLVGPAIVLLVRWLQTGDSRRVVTTAVRIAALSVAVSAWWVVALLIENRYGVDVLDFSESLETVTIASSAPEVLRGLGYWFFYGRDVTGPYLEAALPYMVTALLPLSFSPLLAAVAAAWLLRWRVRGLLVAMIAAATVLAVGAHPYRDPTPFGQAFKAVLERFEPAFALRSVTRVGPLIALGLSMFLGAGIGVLVEHVPRGGRAAVVLLAIVLLVLVAWPLYEGDAVSSTRVRPETIPQYWRDATQAPRGGKAPTRTLEVPGIDFAAYTWGYSHDSITPGLTDRPTVAREVVPYGGVGAIDLVKALDGRIQNRVFDPAALAPIAKLLSAGSIIWRGDLQSERYGLPSPTSLRAALDARPTGLGSPRVYGHPEALARYPVPGARPLERAEPVERAVIVAGSGEGLVDLAEAGLLPDNRLIVYSGSLAGDERALRRLVRSGATLVLTDTNRRQAMRTKTLFGNDGFTERAGEEPLRVDTEDSRIDLFPDSGDRSHSVTVVDGPTARATSYGNPLWLVPATRPMLALDGDPATAWRTGDFWRAQGERIEIDTRAAVRTDRLSLIQAPGGNRRITRVRLTFDGERSVDAELGPPSWEPPGQEIRFPPRRFRTFTVEILETDPPDRANNFGLTGVGFAEITLPGVEPAVEYVRLPRDLLEQVGDAAIDHELVIVLTRLRQGALPATVEPDATDAAELRLARSFRLPGARTFRLSGTARGELGISTPPSGCRDDLLTVDATPVPLRVTAGPDNTWVLTSCDADSLTLAAGTHRLLAADGRITGIHLDRLVLTSTAASNPGGRAPTNPPARVQAVERHRTAVTVQVTHATKPFWLVLGQSHNRGWRAELDGRPLGEPLLVDGYANGWYIEPPRRTFTVRFEWAPQRWIWVGLALSGLALTACVILAIAARGRGGRLEAVPAPADLRSSPPDARTSRVTILAVVGAGILGALFVGQLFGLVTGAGALAVRRLRNGRLVAAAVSLSALGASVVAITLSQRANDYAPDFPWPGSFDSVHRVALASIALLALDAALGRSSRSPSPDGTRSEPA